MSKLDSNRGRVAGIDAGDRTRTGNDRGVRARHALKSRESSVAPADCHIDPQVMEVDIFDLSAVRRETGALSARLFAAVDDVSLALAVKRTKETNNRSMALSRSNSGSDNRSQHCQPMTAADPLKELQRLRLKLATQLEVIATSGRLISDVSRSITKRMQNVSTKMDQLNSDIQQLVPDD